MSNRIWWKEWQAGESTLGLEIWDADASALVDPTYIELPAETTFELGSVKFEYDKRRPVGAQKTPVLTVRVSLDDLEQTLDLRDLRTRILSPRGVDPYEFIFGMETRPFYTTTTWRLYYIDASDVRHTIFIGAQKVAGSLAGSIRNVGTAAAGTTTTITLYHLAQIALMEVKADDMARDMHLKGALGPSPRLYEEIFQDGSTVYGVMVGSDVLDPYPHTKFQAYVELWDSLQDLANQVYQAHMRTTSLSLKLTSPRRDGGEAPWATPADHWGTWKLNYNKDNQAGAALDVDEWLLPTFVTRSDQTFARDDCHAGTLVDQGQGPDRDPSLYRFRTMWDMLGVETLWRKCKLQIKETSWGLNLRFQKLYSSSWSTAEDEPHVYDIDQVRTSAAEWVMGGDAISACKVSMPGMAGDDIADISTRTPLGNAAEEDMTVRALFHNVLSLRSKSDAYARLKGAETAQSISDIDYDHMFVGLHGDPSPFELYYWDTPVVGGNNLTNTDVPIRVHSKVTIDDGLPIILEEGGNDIPWDLPTGDWKSWWMLMRPRMLVEQGDSGMGRAIAELMALTFAQPENVSWPKLVMALEDLPPWMMGELMTMGSGTANAFLDGTATYLSAVSFLMGAIVEWELNTATGLVTFTVATLTEY